MTPAERDRAVAYLEQTKADVLTASSGLSPAQWTFKPSPEQWSAADCIEHLAVSEGFLLERTQKAIAGPATADDVLAQLAGKDEQIIRMVRSRSVKVQAPEPIRPTNRWADPAVLIARFAEVRDRTISYARTTEDPLRTRTHIHPVLGPLDCYQWLIFVAAHSERHLKQMKEALAQHAAGIA